MVNRHRDEPTRSNDSVTLVARAKSDPAFFEQLYQRYVDPVFRYCYRALGNRESAEDATSQIFTRAFSALDTCQNESFRPWLFAIAHNTIANAHRDTRPVVSLDAVEIPAEGPSPEDLAIATVRAGDLRNLLATLPSGQRDVMELRLAGLTGSEIARVLGRSLGSVKIAQVRAFATLREVMPPEEMPDGTR